MAALLAGTRWKEVAEELEADGPKLVAALRERLPGPVTPCEALTALVEAWWELLGRPAREVFVEKTPRHLLNAPVLAARFGSSTRLVGLVRGPRQVLASTRRRWGATRRHAVDRFARRWALATDLVARLDAEREDFLAVRYEDLVRRTGPTMRHVAAHLGLAWDHRLLQPMRGGRAWRANSSFGPGPAAVHAAALDRWRKELPPRDVLALERLLAPRMRAWGYEPVAARAAEGRLRRAWLDARVARDRHALSRAWRRELKPLGAGPRRPSA